jgi:hypothetical protein
MSYWLRELMGWALIAIGLAVFGLVLLHLIEGLVYQTMGMIVVGVFTFRGGIHLLKVALAARVCDEAAAKMHAPAPTVPNRRGRLLA